MYRSTQNTRKTVIEFMLEDSAAKILLTSKKYQSAFYNTSHRNIN